MPQYDSIIIGAGHNGLVCAAYLAKNGQRVLVLESQDSVGGLATNREFHPGFSASVAHSISHFSAIIAKDLDLGSYGFKAAARPLSTIALGVDQNHVTITADSLLGTNQEDQSAYKDYQRLMRKLADVLEPFWLKTMPRIGSSSFSDLATFAKLGLKLRLAGKDDMREFLRIASLPARDLMDEYFSNESLKAALSWDGLVGAKLAPRSPNSAILAMLYRMTGDSRGLQVIPDGGIGALMGALQTAATTAGAEIRCGTAVKSVHIRSDSDGLRADGVELSDGELLNATNIISATDPKRSFIDLVGVRHLDIGFTNRIRRLRCDGFVAKLHLALSGIPDFAGLQRPDGRMILAPNMDTIEFAFDDAKYGGVPAQPVLEVIVPSLRDTSLAPAGQHVLSANVMYMPYAIKGGWTDSARTTAYSNTIDVIAQFAPDIREQILHHEFLTPNDLEEQFNVTGGHWHHTEMAMDQMLMMRPTYEAAQHSTPIPGLFLCGAGCHPGGDITGAPGHNAAREILR